MMVDETNPVIEFTAHDRCDRCGAQAYTLAQNEDAASELLFCLHHRKENYDALLDAGWEIIDDFAAIEGLTDTNPVPV